MLPGTHGIEACKVCEVCSSLQFLPETSSRQEITFMHMSQEQSSDLVAEILPLKCILQYVLHVWTQEHPPCNALLTHSPVWTVSQAMRRPCAVSTLAPSLWQGPGASLLLAANLAPSRGRVPTNAQGGSCRRGRNPWTSWILALPASE